MANANKDQVTVHQHYVPEFYLKNFTDEGLLFSYDLLWKSFSRKSPAQICYADYLYETPVEQHGEKRYALINDLENHFQKRETVFKAVVDKAVSIPLESGMDQHKLTQEDIKILIELATNLFVRNPVVIHMTNEDDLSMMPLNKQKLRDLKDEIGNFGYEEDQLFRLAYKYEWLDERVNNGFVQLIGKVLNKMQLVIYVTQENGFITSDTPVLLKTFENGDLAMLMLPLSPHHLLTFNALEFPRTIVFLPSFAVDIINSVYIRGAFKNIKHVYAQKKSDIERCVRLHEEMKFCSNNKNT